MKRYFVTLFVALTASLAMNARGGDPVAPSFLQPGDTIAVLSLSSTPKAGVIEKGVAAIEKWGFKTVVGQHAASSWRTFAGTPEQRRDDLMKALRDPSVKAIMSSRGGYGSANVLAILPLDTLAKYPKWIIGYSDITGYHSAMVRAGYMSLHANMCGRLAGTGGDDTESLWLRDILMGKIPSYSVPTHKFNRAGRATGILVGGNMSVYGDLAGSPYDFLDNEFVDNRNIVLFIEDVGEGIAKLDRMLQHLRVRGLLDKVQGVIVGRFDDCPPSRGYASTLEMIHDYLKDYDIPVCYDFPTGHDEDWNYPLIEGCPVTLEVGHDAVKLTFDLPRP